MAISRRHFLASAAGAAIYAPQAARAALATDVPWAGEKVIDCHFHARPTDEAMIAHLDGAGITSALALANGDFAGRMPALKAKYPGRIPGWAHGSLLKPDDAAAAASVPSSGRALPATTAVEAVAALRVGVKDGAHGFAETAGRVAVDGPELQRIYALASELDVPVMMHFQEAGVPGQPVYGITGFSRIESMLKKYPKTRFVCHASDFWGNIDASYHDGGVYPTGKVNRGGLSDRLLADYANMHGDLSAPSGLIQLARDPDFTADFMTRHQHKLLFGSDCGCTDGRGGTPAGLVLPPAMKPGTMPLAPGANTNAPASTVGMAQRMAALGGFAGKCIARELLGVTWRATSREVFRKLVWENGRRVYKLA